MLAAERMKEALERIDSAAMFIVAGERMPGSEQAEQNLLRFEQALETQQSNITERGEPEATAVLRRAWATYRGAYARFAAGTDHAALEADYFKTMNPLFVATKAAADRILDLNQDAMVRKRDQARRAAERSNAAMIATALLASLIGFFASLVLTNRILRPLSVLGATARRLGEGDMEVRAKVSRQDEIGTLARDFNAMADRLAQYRHSSLGELLQAQQQAQAAIDSLPDPVLDLRSRGAFALSQPRRRADPAGHRRGVDRRAAGARGARRSAPSSSGCGPRSSPTTPDTLRRGSTRRFASP